MSNSANIGRANNLRAGRAYAPNAPFSSSLSGILMSHLLAVRWGPGSKQGFPAPIVLDADGICAAQAVAGAADATIDGALAAAGIAELDVARTLSMVSSSASDTTQTVTVRGLDILGRAVTETRTLNGTNSVAFLKAFKRVTRVSVSAAMVGNLTLGTTNTFGLPVRVRVGDVMLKVLNDAAPEAGTIVVGDTATATATTGDPLGTFLSGTAPNGARVYTALIAIEDNTESAYGTQYSA